MLTPPFQGRVAIISVPAVLTCANLRQQARNAMTKHRPEFSFYTFRGILTASLLSRNIEESQTADRRALSPRRLKVSIR
jgi:hypothetical protein